MAEILPIDIDKLTTEPVQDDKITIKVETPPPSPLPSSPPPTDVSDDEEPPKKEIKKELFDKPKILPPVIISKRTGKPKRKMTDKQLANLAKAQEASRKKRGAVKEAREMAKTAKKMEIEKRKQEKVESKLEADAMIEMRRQIYLEESARAKADATWDEGRLTALMTKTIGNFLDEKKKQKPKPKEFIPAQPQYQQFSPQHPQNQYSQPYNYQAQPQANYATNKPIYQQKKHANMDTMNNLFGYNPQ